MTGPRKLLRLRRRSDKVKLALLLFLLGALLIADLLRGAAEYFSTAGEPVEYVLSAGAEGAALDIKLRELMERESVVCASRQREYTLASGESAATVTEVSAEYLKACFGLEDTGAGVSFFMGRKAFAALCGRNARSPARLTCLAGEERVYGAFTLEESLPEELALSRGTSVTLGGEKTLRVMMRGMDVSGVETKWLEESGFVIENREVVEEAAHETELLITRLRYGGLACVLALLLGRQLFKAGSM